MTRRKPVVAWGVVGDLSDGSASLFSNKAAAEDYALRWRAYGGCQLVKLVPHSPAKEKLVRAAVRLFPFSDTGGRLEALFRAVARYKRERRK